MHPNPPQFSVIVVSRGRPGLLRRCLIGLEQLYYPAFEIIVVADPDGIRQIVDMGWRDRIKIVAFDLANISAARNAGIAVAAGEIIAFIDDDAVAEPSWLDHMSAAFADPDVVGAGGYVRGRNGISFQFRAAMVSTLGEEVAVRFAGDAPGILPARPGHAPKTMGTNCAFRRKQVALMGGLDPVFRFFHDETDLNMRLHKCAKHVAVVPLAQVHHGYAASDRRGADRTPHSLFEIGASSALFLRKHAPKARHAEALGRLRAEQRKRLLRHMVSGGLEPRDVARLMVGFEAGIEDGRKRQIAPLAPIPESENPLLSFQRKGATHEAVYFAGRTWNRRRLHRQALKSLAKGDVTTVFRFSPTALFHTVRFLQHGYWLQKGGLFGRANRTDKAINWTSFTGRVSREWGNVARLRQRPEFSPIRSDDEIQKE